MAPREEKMTAQFPESIYYKGEKMHTVSQPLATWLESAGVKRSFRVNCTACWRGYLGRWYVYKGKLYLTHIGAHWEDDGSEVLLSELFSGHEGWVFAEWFSGEVHCPRGELLKSGRMGIGSVYERDLFLEFDRGVLVRERERINSR